MNITGENQTALRGTASVRPEMTAGDKKRLKEACTDFEAVMLNSMFQAMRNTLSGEDIFGQSLGKDIYESMYYQELSNVMAKSGKGPGIGDQLYQQLAERNPRHQINENI